MLRAGIDRRHFGGWWRCLAGNRRFPVHAFLRLAAGRELLTEGLFEAALDFRERHAVLRAARTGEAGLDRAEVERQEIAELGVAGAIFTEKALSATILLDELDLGGWASGRGQVTQGFGVDRKEAAGGAVFR